MQRGSHGRIEVLPVTALETVLHGKNVFLFVGSGTNLTLIETQENNTRQPSNIYRLRLFDSQAIHGISAVKTCETGACVGVELFAYGGRALAWLQLGIFLSSDERSPAACKLLGFAHTDLSQWIMFGKTCCEQNKSDLFAVILTSHNELLHACIDSKSKVLNIVTISNRLPAFLYSADLSVISNERYMIASGTAFGEILTWTCAYDAKDQSWHSKPWKEFSGHLGSIFGLRISNSYYNNGQSQRLLVSSSDDRTIRLWDVSDLDRETVFSTESSLSESNSGPSFLADLNDLCTQWAHDSRIWAVDVEIQDQIDPRYVSIISTGEDGQVISWHVSLGQCLKSGTKLTMKNIQNDRYHVGKNLWAFSKLTSSIFSGGADGQIVCRRRRDHSYAAAQYSQSFKSITETVLQTSTTSRTLTFKSYRIGRNTPRHIIADTEKGELLRCSLQEELPCWKIVIQDCSEKAMILASSVEGKYVFFVEPSSARLAVVNLDDMQILSICDLPQASISRLDLLNSASEEEYFCLATTYHGNQDIVLSWFSIGHCALETRHSYLATPEAFVVTSMLYDRQAQLVICGSRAGAIGVYSGITPHTQRSVPAACIRHVHGSDTVTSIQFLECIVHHSGTKAAFYLTTGKDGHFCILSISRTEGDFSTPVVHIVHRSESFLGRHLEGAHLLHQQDRVDIVLYGFHADNFVVWNETKQVHLIEIGCGGAHREWDFTICTTPNEASSGTLVWTKEKSVNICTRDLEDHSVIQTGSHGREIKALAVHQKLDNSWLVATGSEDTNIRLFEYDQGGLRNISVLIRHKSGLQDLRFSDNGQHLMSGAGMEELLAWRLRPVPVIKLGVVCTASLTIKGSIADARLMALDMVTLNNSKERGEFTYNILAAFSNGRVKQIAYTETDAYASFTVLAQIDMGSICLTQSQLLNPISGGLIAGTNGFITSLDLSNPPTIKQTSNRRIHQNNITTLSAHRLLDENILIITGGDDNALAFTVSSPTGYKTTIVPKAHAAALTALAVHKLPNQSDAFAIMTAGNDQRLNIWTAHVMDQKVSIGFLESRYTNVADISEIAILDTEINGDESKIDVLVVGVGMEIMGFGKAESK